MGSTVLNVTGSLSSGRTVRVYAHCTCQRNSRYKDGDVVLLVLNIRKSFSTLSLHNDKFASASRDVYWLEPNGKAGLISKSVTIPLLRYILLFKIYKLFDVIWLVF